MRTQDELIKKAKSGRTVIPKKGGRPFTGGPVKRFIFVDENLFPEAGVYQAVHLARNLPKEIPDYLTEHHHLDCDEIYLFIGFGKDLRGLTAEVQLDNSRKIVKSPAACLIPKKKKHRYRVVKGEGVVVITLLKKGYKWKQDGRDS